MIKIKNSLKVWKDFHIGKYKYLTTFITSSSSSWSTQKCCVRQLIAVFFSNGTINHNSVITILHTDWLKYRKTGFHFISFFFLFNLWMIWAEKSFGHFLFLLHFQCYKAEWFQVCLFCLAIYLPFINRKWQIKNDKNLIESHSFKIVNKICHYNMQHCDKNTYLNLYRQ